MAKTTELYQLALPRGKPTDPINLDVKKQAADPKPLSPVLRKCTVDPVLQPSPHHLLFWDMKDTGFANEMAHEV